MSSPQMKIADVIRRDPRYAYPAYLFIFEGLEYTQELVAAEEEDHSPRHVTGPELLEGVRDLALREFGMLARIVFQMWGIHTTDDVGEIVFNLIDAGLLSKTDSDDRADFHSIFDLEKALAEGYEINLDETPWAKQRERR